EGRRQRGGNRMGGGTAVDDVDRPADPGVLDRDRAGAGDGVIVVVVKVDGSDDLAGVDVDGGVGGDDVAEGGLRTRRVGGAVGPVAHRPVVARVLVPGRA